MSGTAAAAIGRIAGKNARNPAIMPLTRVEMAGASVVNAERSTGARSLGHEGLELSGGLGEHRYEHLARADRSVEVVVVARSLNADLTFEVVATAAIPIPAMPSPAAAIPAGQGGEGHPADRADGDKGEADRPERGRQRAECGQHRRDPGGDPAEQARQERAAAVGAAELGNRAAEPGGEPAARRGAGTVGGGQDRGGELAGELLAGLVDVGGDARTERPAGVLAGLGQRGVQLALQRAAEASRRGQEGDVRGADLSRHHTTPSATGCAGCPGRRGRGPGLGRCRRSGRFGAVCRWWS